MKGLTVVGLLVVAGVAVAAEGFVPGKTLSPDDYTKLSSELSNAKGAAALERTLAMNAAVDKETRPAMAEVFSNPTAVYFHLYSPPGSRPRTKDGADGLRVVWEREIDVAGEKRLMSVITFWEYDATSETMKMRTGDDSIRVRVELAGEDVPLFQRFAGLSYTTKTDESGNIVSVEPGVYVGNDGELREGIAHQAMPSDCSGCHSSGRRKNFRETMFNAKDSNDYKSLLEDLAKNGVGGDAIRRIEDLKNDPKKNFLPPGIRDALSGKPSAKGGDPNASAAMAVVVITGDAPRPLHHWNGGRADATKPVPAAAPAPRAGTAQGAGMLRD